jgi:hypothetical protein
VQYSPSWQAVQICRHNFTILLGTIHGAGRQTWMFGSYGVVVNNILA